MVYNNSANINPTGLVRADGSGGFNGVTTTQYNVQVGAASNGLTSVAPSATSGIPLISQGVAANPTFGTVEPAGGGLGITTIPTNGQVPIGNGTNYTAATLTAGSGISITNGAGSITISASSSVNSWVSTSGSFTAASDTGYYITNTSTPTLPAAPTDGDYVVIYLRTINTCTITANTGQYIRVGNQFTALAGTVTGNVFGNSIWLVYRAADASWEATSVVGIWTVTEFTPASLSSQYLWLDGNDPLGTGIPPSSGANVLPIDKFGVQTFTQATTSKRPTYTPSGLNGRGVLTASSASGTSIQCTGAAYGNNVSFYMICTPSSSSNAYVIGGSDVVSNSPSFLSNFNIAGGVKAFVWYNTSDIVNLATSATGYHVLAATVTTTNTQLNTYYDGTSISSGNYLTALNTRALTNVFAATNTLNYYSGNVAEFIIYTQVLSAANQRLLNMYFQKKWNLELGGIN